MPEIALYALAYVAIGCLFALWLAHHPRGSTPNADDWMWIVTILLWPLTIVLFVALLIKVVREKTR